MVRPETGAVLGPVQVLLIGIDEHGADRMLAAELQDLGNQDAIRVVDVLRVRRGTDDEVQRLEPPTAGGFAGTLVEALLVTEVDRPAPSALVRSPGSEGLWFLADRIPVGTAAAVLLIEHRWAIPLREAAADVRAEIFGDAWVHPSDLAAALASEGASG